MREIKFRGKSLLNGRWAYGSLDRNPYTEQSHILVYEEIDHDGVDFFTDFVEVDPKTVGQHTGLKDKNGTEIYEGDIVKHSNGQISIVTWSNGDWGWYMQSVRNWNPKTVFDSSKDEVIGNKYENPELLGDKELGLDNNATKE